CCSWRWRSTRCCTGRWSETVADGFGVVVASGTLRSATEPAVHFPHRWTEGGVSVQADFTGAHLLHLAAAGCVLDDVHREARARGVPLEGCACVPRGASTPTRGPRRASATPSSWGPRRRPTGGPGPPPHWRA